MRSRYTIVSSPVIANTNSNPGSWAAEVSEAFPELTVDAGAGGAAAVPVAADVADAYGGVPVTNPVAAGTAFISVFASMAVADFLVLFTGTSTKSEV